MDGPAVYRATVHEDNFPVDPITGSQRITRSAGVVSLICQR